MSKLLQSVRGYVRQKGLIKAGDRVAVAVSGGADSVALLRILLECRSELGILVSVAHFNHQLRGAESDGDEAFVAALARTHGLLYLRDSGDVTGYAEQHSLSLEAAARQLRYAYFERLIAMEDPDSALNRIATAHTLDDQAETVLLRLLRGAGTRGLAGIFPVRKAGTGCGAIVRPLLQTSRQQIEEYLQALGQTWREDSSNRDLRHARNRVRHTILPLMARELNSNVLRTLASMADVARAEEEYWSGQVATQLDGNWRREGRERGRLSISPLLQLPTALRRRVVRAAAESLGLRLEFEHVEEALQVAARELKSANLPKGWQVRRHSGALVFRSASEKLSSILDRSYREAGQA